jgi:hypothetical protein
MFIIDSFYFGEYYQSTKLEVRSIGVRLNSRVCAPLCIPSVVKVGGTRKGSNDARVFYHRGTLREGTEAHSFKQFNRTTMSTKSEE